ncbi:MAG: aminotransferase class I/II-fold pyridoxal phosphate-dependent enzyme [Elusimicrobia bacterium]|nr:aminotransferase class I/II-fold pyridoxal phosphate-dependent enzyme [Elusimicrobiota bacterium]
MKPYAPNSSLSTLCVHAGSEPDPLTGAVMPPVYMTSTYAQQSPGVHKGYEYSRTQNPTRERLERALAALEGARHGLAFASGLAAEDAILRLLKPGDHVLCGRDLYGGTYRLMKRVWERYGLNFDFVDASNARNFVGALKTRTRMIWIESPSNPLLSVADFGLLTVLLKKRRSDLLVVVDNTFATPIFQQPLSLGADLVIHSTTKYIGGHSDVIGGAVMTNRDETAQGLRFLQNAAGAVPGPMDCFLTMRGIKTLALRMKAHETGAGKVARYLSEHYKVERVYYPGLNSHPGHENAGRQMTGFGGMVSFDIRGDGGTATEFFSALRLFTVGESLGGVESLACYPWIMTHAAIPEEERLRSGIKDTLIRLSVGIENPKDLINDLSLALEQV